MYEDFFIIFFDLKFGPINLNNILENFKDNLRPIILKIRNRVFISKNSKLT